MNSFVFTLLIAISAMGLITRVTGDQPIMNMMPRWDGGYGVQAFHEVRHESKLLDGDSELGDGLTETVHLIHLEGVYTWDRSIRLTAKLPFILDAEREILTTSGTTETQSDSGIGDLTLALPLKKYFNELGRSGSYTIAPQLRIPLGEKDEYEIPDRVWGAGLSLGYEFETSSLFFATGVSVWLFETQEPAELHINLDLGWNFHTNGQLLWETDYHYEDDGSHTLTAGPALYWRFSDLIHARTECKYDIYDHQGDIDHGSGYYLKTGIAFVW